MFDKKEYKRQYRQEHKEYFIKYNKQYRINNSEKLKEYMKRWQKNNSEKLKEYMKKYSRQYYINNPEKVKEYDKQYCRNNPKRVKDRKRQYYINNYEKMKKYSRQYRINNPEYMKEYIKNRRKTDLKFNLNQKTGTAIWASLKGNKNGKHWETLVPYTVIDLEIHLRKTIPFGYTWKDYMKGKLHIDHIIPIDAFNFTKPEDPDFKRCWALSNLRLLPASENLRKSNKLLRPFQPALKF